MTTTTPRYRNVEVGRDAIPVTRTMSKRMFPMGTLLLRRRD